MDEEEREHQKDLFRIQEEEVRVLVDRLRTYRWDVPNHFVTELEGRLERLQFLGEGLGISIGPLHREARRLVRRLKAGTHWSRREDELVLFVRTEDLYVIREVEEIRQLMGGAGFHEMAVTGRIQELCKLVYEQLQGHEYVYELEPAVESGVVQRIRTPTEIERSRTATCIDLACLFAAFLEAMRVRPVILLLRGHALAGYWKGDPPGHPVLRRPEVLDFCRSRSFVCIETTGAVRSRVPVRGVRRSEDGTLSFEESLSVAERIVDTELEAVLYLVDVEESRMLA